MIRNILAAAAITAASLAAVFGAALPASASVPAPAPAIASAHVMFTVTDSSNGALSTRQPVAPGQVVYSGGVALTLNTVRADGGTYLITFRGAGLPASDDGTTVPFST